MTEIRVTEEHGSSGTVAQDPEVARAEIEQTRARMSGTIDEIEEALLRKKENIQEKLDVFSSVRDNAFPSAGAAFGVGLLLGLVTGGGDDEKERPRRHRGSRGEHPRRGGRSGAGVWEARSHRLLEIAREQEEEIQELEERFGEVWSDSIEGTPPARSEPNDVHSTLGSLGDMVAGGVAHFVSELASSMTGSGQPARR